MDPIIRKLIIHTLKAQWVLRQYICVALASGHGKTLAFALNDMFTGVNFLIALISAMIGYVVFEYLRRKL